MSPGSRRATSNVIPVALTGSVVVATIVLLVLNFSWGTFDSLTEAAGEVVRALVAPVGAGFALMILLQRPGHPVGWLLMLSSIGIAVEGGSSLVLDSAPAPAQPIGWLTWLVLWVDNWAWILIMFPIFHLLHVFPTGKLLGRRWRWLVGLELVMAAFILVVAAISDPIGPLDSWGGDRPWVANNPIGFVGADLWEGPAGIVWSIALATVTIGGAVSLITRYRRADHTERQQIKWLLYAVAVLAVVYTAGIAIGGTESALEELVLFTSVMGVPVAVAIAVLRFRLYDIDKVISRTLVWAGLAVFMALFYVTVVLALGVVGIALAAVAFQPVRRWLQQMANRIVYGRRATPYEVLSDLTRTLTNVESTTGVMQQTARRLGEATAAEKAMVWMFEGDLLHPVAAWPADTHLPAPSELGGLPGDVTVIRTEDDASLGALTVEKRRGDPVTTTERRLIEDLAGSSASVLRNAALQAELSERAVELAASRRRLLEVQDSERRRMERELDDGAQQIVVSLKVKLNVAARLARADGAEALADLLDGMDKEAREAITQIRSLAKGLYPPLLEAEGLATAVRALAETSPIPVRLVIKLGPDRLPLELEAAIFFCVSEAITNAVKHAGDQPVTVDLSRAATSVTFEVADSGSGFDPKMVALGSGLHNMADRLDAIGGTLSIESTPGRGTRVRGAVPLPGSGSPPQEPSSQQADIVSGSRSDFEMKATAPAARAGPSNSAAS